MKCCKAVLFLGNIHELPLTHEMKGKETDLYIDFRVFELSDYLSIFLEFVPVQSYVLKIIYTQNTSDHALFLKYKCFIRDRKGVG